MIRRFFTLLVFTATINLAAFGQHIFGRDDLIHWAHEVQKHGPAQAKIAWAKTDRVLASITPNAGSEKVSCFFEDLQFPTKIYHS
jgi:formaldehyde-activating enzyme involved in methanogenesis